MSTGTTLHHVPASNVGGILTNLLFLFFKPGNSTTNIFFHILPISSTVSSNWSNKTITVVSGVKQPLHFILCVNLLDCISVQTALLHKAGRGRCSASTKLNAQIQDLSCLQTEVYGRVVLKKQRVNNRYPFTGRTFCPLSQAMDAF